MQSLEGSLAEDYCRLETDWLARRRTEKPLGEAGGGVKPFMVSESCPPSTTLHVLHLTQLQQSQALSFWIEKLKANFVLTFVVLSCFQFPAFTLLLAILIPEPIGEFFRPVQIEQLLSSK
ncbi:hypothetical protein ATANTOWER_009751 [Ataeniobius toweri]|uniref:Uncharacterized protein n=1 Tax=Ataeniobius toweri TaxID=208326 RepID=A0ABU7AYU8_9TELE|nr:hypothetical protein [Ataeniobius toweri]